MATKKKDSAHITRLKNKIIDLEAKVAGRDITINSTKGLLAQAVELNDSVHGQLKQAKEQLAESNTMLEGATETIESLNRFLERANTRAERAEAQALANRLTISDTTAQLIGAIAGAGYPRNTM